MHFRNLCKNPYNCVTEEDKCRRNSHASSGAWTGIIINKLMDTEIAQEEAGRKLTRKFDLDCQASEGSTPDNDWAGGILWTVVPTYWAIGPIQMWVVREMDATEAGQSKITFNWNTKL